MARDILRVGLVGYGNWGTKLGRNLDAHRDCQLRAVSDTDAARRAAARRSHPHAHVVDDYRALLDSNEIDAAVVATPAGTHFEIGWDCLQSGKDLLVEKPFTLRIEDAEALAGLAEAKSLMLAVDYTYLYNSHVLAMKELLENGGVGAVTRLEFVRVNNNSVQDDIDVVYDLACHDLSIVDFLLDRLPIAGCVLDSSTNERSIMTAATLQFLYPEAVESVHRVDWTAPSKQRKLMVTGSQRSILYQEVEGNESLTLYETPTDLSTLRSSKARVIVPPQTQESLFVEIDQFLRCVRSRVLPLSNAQLAIRVMRVLERCRASAARNEWWSDAAC